MKRRHFIHIGMAGIAGCGKKQPENVAKVSACPFAVTIPEKWRKSAIIENVPIAPLYSSDAWQAYQKDKFYGLKPGYYNRPQHWAIRLPAVLPEGISFDRENAGDDPTAPQILIHKADEWSVAYTDGEHQDPVGTLSLGSLRERMDAALTQDEPYLSPGYVDGSLGFMCLKRRLDFTGGHGIRIVVQRTVEAELMRLGQLHYLFVGMSDDNSVQIIATFPINLPGLPGPDARNHLGRSTENYTEFSKTYDEYCNDAKRWLEQHADKITPSFQELDGMLQSLVAPHWNDS